MTRLVDRLPRSTAATLREAKHRASVFAKHATWGFPQVRGPLLEPAWVRYQERHPYPFPREAYAGTWLDRDVPGRAVVAGEPVPHRVFVLWTGDNPFPQRREAGLAAIAEANPGLEVALVTPASLGDWVVPGQPLHPAYEHLSLVHRSDYLRAYLLHHHGGVYADVKRPRTSWAAAIGRFEASDAWLAGYREVHRLNAPLVGGRLQRDLRRVSAQLLGYGVLVARRDTPITQEWLERVEVVLDEHVDALAAHPGNVRGDNAGYPLSWTEVLAHVVAPLTWKHQAHVRQERDLLPVLKDYV